MRINNRWRWRLPTMQRAMTGLFPDPWLSALVAIFFAVAILCAQPVAAQGPAASKSPPATRTDDAKDNYFGVEVADPYRWLEDQESPETRAWITAQNIYTRFVLDALPGRGKLKERLTALLNVESFQLPVERNSRYFFAKRGVGLDQFVLYVRKGPTGADEPLVDPQPLSPDHSVSVSLEAVSNDGTLMAYGVRQGGQDEAVPHIFDVEARKNLPDVLPRARYFSLDFTRDNSGIYYARVTADGPRVYYHKMGTDYADDSVVFGQGYGPEIILQSKLSDDGSHLVIHVLYGASGDRTDIYVQDLAARRPMVTVVKGIPARFFALAAGDRLFIYTNWKAPKGRVLVADLKDPAPERWREIVAEGSATMENFELTGGRVGVFYTENASSRASLFEPDGKLVREISLPAIGSISGFNGRWGSGEAFYRFESFHIPNTIYHYDASSGAAEIWAKPHVPFDSDKYEVKQVWYTSKDGTRVPMFLVYARGTKPTGLTPTLLTGYGGFEVSETPAYSARTAAWIESGGIYASANLRGGSEFGEAWHRAGMLEKKQNVFDDFIAAAEWLIQNHYTNRTKLAIRGGSNGGLLVGAALTQRPDLFGAVICSFPLLDMLRYQKFLVAKFWVPEYGSADDPAQFKYIYAYSPYQHVKPGTNYPAVLFISGDSDTRVAPLHARKMAALMQAAAAPGCPILLRYDTKAGHTAAEPVSKQVDELVDELSFLDWQMSRGVTGGISSSKTLP